jgi:hypothetical protein
MSKIAIFFICSVLFLSFLCINVWVSVYVLFCFYFSSSCFQEPQVRWIQLLGRKKLISMSKTNMLNNNNNKRQALTNVYVYVTLC